MKILENLFKRYRKGVFIVIYKIENKKLKYLLLKRKLHWIGWEFPKGGIKKKETELQAVKREVKEETGLNLINIKSHNKKGKYKYSKTLKDRERVKGQTYSLFSARLSKGKLKIDNIEHSGYKWIDYQTALKILTWKNQKECLDVVNKNIKRIFSSF